MSTFITMAFRYLAGRKMRTTLTTLAIVFGVAVILAGNLTLPGAIAAFRSVTLTTADAVDMTVTSRTGAAFNPDAPLAALAKVKGVQAASPVLRQQVYMPGPDGKATTTQTELVGIDPATIGAVRDLKLSTGRALQPGDHGVALAQASPIAGVPQPKLGDKETVISAAGTEQYEVVGLLDTSNKLATAQLVVPLADAQASLAQPKLVNAIELALAPGVNRDAVKRDVLAATGDGFQVDAVTTQVDTFSSLQVGYAIFNLFGLLTLFIGAFLIFNTFRTVVVERRHDLGMLRALGAEQRQITGMIVVESLLQGVLGTAVGLVVGYLFALGMAAALNGFVGNFLPGVHLTVILSAQAVLMAVVFGLLTTLIAGYVPARAAGKVSPLAALRPSPTADVRGARRWALTIGLVFIVLAVVLLFSGPTAAAGGALLFLIGLAIASPALVHPAARLFSPFISLWFGREGDVASGNVTREPGRAAVTASTLMIGLAVLVLSFGMVKSFGTYVSDLFARNLSSDLILMPQNILLGANVGAGPKLAEQLRAVPGMQAVGEVRFAGTVANGQNASVLGMDPASYAQVFPLIFTQGKPDEAYAALQNGRTTIVNQIFAATYKVKPGDDLTLQTVQGPQVYHVVAVGGDALNFKLATVYISQANLSADFGRNDDVLLAMKLKPGADLAAVKQSVAQIAAGYPQFTLYVTAEYRNNLMAQSTQAMNMFYAIALIILIPASLGLLNTLTINVLERTREIGTLRAIGADRRQVRRMVMAEALLLGLFGAAIGVLAGVAMSYGFLAAFGSLGWKLPLVISVAGIVAAIVVGVLLAIFAALLPARNAAKLDIIRALHYE
jgi:putative ABC transport system permease protein